MIKYALQCGRAHRFEAWFRSSQDCASQLDARQVACPHCGDEDVEKSIMAPSVSTTRRDAPALEPSKPAKDVAISTSPTVPMTTPDALKRMVEARLRAMRAYVEANAEHVGPRFAEEARRIHEGDSEERPIYGEASPEEVEALVEDGVPCAPLPWIDTRDD